MAKLIGPLMSFGSSGQIGKAMVTGSWKGIAYARQYVVPANPRTTAQQENRFRFRNLGDVWKLAPASVKNAFNAFAQGRRFAGVNAFVGQNNRLLVGETSYANALMSPGALGGLPPISVTATTGVGSGEIDVEIIPPSQLPDGWTISGAQFVAFPDDDPTTTFDGPFVSDSDATDPYQVTLAGLPAATPCVAYAWLTYLRADGKTAYSVSLSDTATSGA